MSATPSETVPSGSASRFVTILLRYYRVFLLMVVALLFSGIGALLTLPRTEDPEFDAYSASVTTLFPGADARKVESLVTRPIEEALEEVDEVEVVESISIGGLSRIRVLFHKDVVPLEAQEEVEDRVEEVRPQLPGGAREPEVNAFNSSEMPVVTAALHGTDDYALLDLWSERIENELEGILTVSQADVEGLPERRIVVDIDNDRLSQYGIALVQLVKWMRRENAGVPGGKLDSGSRRFLLQNPNEFRSLDDIREMVIGRSATSVVRLGDVATVRDEYRQDRYLVRYMGRPAVLVTASKRDGTNTVAVADRIKARLAEIEETLPEPLELVVVNDRGDGVSELLGNLSSNALAGGVIVLLMVALFLGRRQALVVSTALPLSVLVAFLLMQVKGIALHQISIFGLILALGMLVDSALVVVENIGRHLEEGLELPEAVSRGTDEVKAPVLSSMLTTVAAFVPLMFITGDIGEFISAMPWTLMFALAGSALVALTVVPLLCYAMWQRFPPPADGEHQKGRIDRLLDRATEHYGRIAARVLERRALTVAVALAGLFASFFLLSRLGLEFFPASEKRFFLIDVRLPREANLATTRLVTEQVERLLASREEVHDFTTNLGKGGPRIYYNEVREVEQPNYAEILVNLKPETSSTDRFLRSIRPELDRIAGAQVEAALLKQGPISGAPIQVRLVGDDLEDLARKADEIAAELRAVPGAVNVRDSLGSRSPSLRLEYDRERAGLLGISTWVFSRTVNMAVDGQQATWFLDGDEEVPVILRLEPRALRDTADLGRLIVPTSSERGVQLGEVARIVPGEEFAEIHRRNRRRVVNIEAEVEGRLVSEVAADLEERLADFVVPEGYELQMGGEGEERGSSFEALGRALLLAVLFIYAILAVQFNSFVQPFVILLTVPFGIVGAVVGLWLTSTPFGFMAFIGVVSLTGIIINDSIVLTDFANYLQRVEGRPRNEALLEAGRIRFRPVLLTSITTIAGMTPLAIWGGSMWSPVAVAVIFGLMGATGLILLLLPVIYSLVVPRREGRRAFRVRLWWRFWRRVASAS